MTDETADSPTPKQHPLDRIVEALPMPVRKLGRDLTISVFFNACAYVSHTLPMLVAADDTVGAVVRDSLTDSSFGIAYVTASIAAGRYIGGAMGALYDRATGHTEDQKYRRMFAAAAGTLTGTAALIAHVRTPLVLAPLFW
jgi:hypothetical protein